MADVADRLNAVLAGRYRIGRELGRGGMATVFLADDEKHHRPVAIKVLAPEVAAALGSGRFLREIESTARLTHPHILPLHDSGDAAGLLYYVMPYVEGESLRQRLEREKQLPIADALRIAREVADALDYAHGQGVVHRDIKPENILLSERHAVVADFGIARAIAAAGGERLTETGVAIGTPAYMSPEQAVGSRALDGRSDLYSLACVVYEMLAGEPPFTGVTGESLAHQHLSVAPRPVRELRTAVPEEMSRALSKALAKPAADRFATAAELAAALESAPTIPDHAGVAPRAERPGSRRRMRRVRTIAIAAVATLAAIGTLATIKHPDWLERGLGGSSAAHPAKKDWILVAEFDGPADDSSLAVTIRSLVSAALDQSEIVATLPREQIQLALKLAGKPANTRLDASLARELAYRRSVRAVLEGEIGRLGRGYSMVLRVVDAESLKTVVTKSGVARNEDALIPMIGRLAEQLRAGLGERRSAIAATRPVGEVATPSFEAYRLYTKAGLEGRSGHWTVMMSLFRDALALDPDFAQAWVGLGVGYGNTGLPDSALAAYGEALRRPQRLTTAQRFFAEALRASENGDPRATLAAYDRALQYSTGSAVHNNRALALVDLGRFEEALESMVMSERASPFGASQAVRQNKALCLCRLGRMEEARAIARTMPGWYGQRARTAVEIAAGNWRSAEKILDSLLADPNIPEAPPGEFLHDLASAQAARGALRAAEATCEHAEEMFSAAGAPLEVQDGARRARLMLAVVSRGVIPLPADAWARDSSAATLITRGLRAAGAGDGAGAQRLLAAARARPPRELQGQGAAPTLLEARIEALAGRWDAAARILRPVASQPKEVGLVLYPAGMCVVRWFLADAFEKLGRPDSAAAYLERAVSDPAISVDETHLRGIVWPFAHQRLVLLYARMGRIEEAERHLAILERDFTTPDPELRHLLDDARAAVRSARGMARPEPKPS